MQTRKPASEATGAGKVAATKKNEACQLEGEYGKLAARASRRARREATKSACYAESR